MIQEYKDKNKVSRFKLEEFKSIWKYIKDLSKNKSPNPMNASKIYKTLILPNILKFSPNNSLYISYTPKYFYYLVETIDEIKNVYNKLFNSLSFGMIGRKKIITSYNKELLKKTIKTLIKYNNIFIDNNLKNDLLHQSNIKKENRNFHEFIIFY